MFYKSNNVSPSNVTRYYILREKNIEKPEEKFREQRQMREEFLMKKKKKKKLKDIRNYRRFRFSRFIFKPCFTIVADSDSVRRMLSQDIATKASYFLTQDR